MQRPRVSVRALLSCVRASWMRTSPMRSVVFEGDTWERYEALRAKDKQLDKNLCPSAQERR